MSLSRTFWLRSAGFPIGWVSDLGIEASRPVVAQLYLVMDELRGLGAGRRAGGAAEAAPDALAVRRKQLTERRAALEAEGEALFTADARAVRSKVVERLSGPLAEEALFLLNPAALERVRSLGQGGAAQLDSRRRQHVRLAWSYLQRLCTKNDTVSFFGPMAWGRMSGLDEPVRLSTTGPGWIKRRIVSFEHWAAVALGAAISADPEVSPHLPLRLNAGCHVEGTELRYPLNKRTRLSAPAADFLRFVGEARRHGAWPAAELSARFARETGQGLEEVERACSFLLEKGVLVRNIEVPTAEHRPEERVRRTVAALPEACPGRARWLHTIDGLLALRERYQGGALEERARTSSELYSVLKSLGINTDREAGSMYTGRYVVYEDCERSLFIELGRSVEARLGAVLEPVCNIYRWLAKRAAQLIHARYERVYRELCAEGDEEGVDFLLFFTTVRKSPALEPSVELLRGELRAAWGRLLGPAPADDAMIEERDLVRLLGWLEESGPTDGAPEPLGVDVHSPDLLIAARDLEALRSGEYQIIVGEVHPGVHNVSQPVAQPFSPFSREIQEEVDALLAPGRMVLVDPALGHQRSNLNWPVVTNLHDVLMPGDDSRSPLSRQVATGNGRVVLRDGGVKYLDRASGRLEDIITVMPRDFHRMLFDLAADVLGAAHPCRISCGNFMLKRRTWRASGSSLPNVKLPGESFQSFMAVHAWARALGLPRWVFVKCPGEPKPIYVDFENPLAVDLFYKQARQADDVTISEMRPGPDELWLADERGAFTSELRTSFTTQGSPR
ncbi:lantibiotic dehydratase [Sorangium sp. So ce887]|uniref:lantibiotic dehydratase n=1 Tax=Sorangium sp. So ce887 TaxID=3133324 RepID=UPI003F6224B1